MWNLTLQSLGSIWHQKKNVLHVKFVKVKISSTILIEQFHIYNPYTSIFWKVNYLCDTILQHALHRYFIEEPISVYHWSLWLFMRLECANTTSMYLKLVAGGMFSSWRTNYGYWNVEFMKQWFIKMKKTQSQDRCSAKKLKSMEIMEKTVQWLPSTGTYTRVIDQTK